MSALSIISTVAIVLFRLYLVISPYLRKEVIEVSKYADSPPKEETIDKKDLMVTLNEIEFDYRSHKISDEDFHKLSRQYESILIRTMHETEKSSKDDSL